MKKPLDLHIRVSPRFLEVLDKACKDLSETRSTIIRHACNDFLSRKGYFHG